MCEKLVKYIYKNTFLILCQSLTYKKKISQLNKTFVKKTFYFPSWPEEIKNQIVKKKEKDYEIFSKNKINILFTGNIGDAQNFGLIIELVKATQKEINWIIAGKGRRFDFS